MTGWVAASVRLTPGPRSYIEPEILRLGSIMAKSAAPVPPPEGEIRIANLADALGERYLSYALSTIMARSLPDVRDGLKPVHRRLLYAHARS